MDEKGKSYWRPPELPKLEPPLPYFDDLPISAWLRTPPILPKGLHPDEKNYTAVSSNEQWTRERYLGTPFRHPNFNPEDLEVAMFVPNLRVNFAAAPEETEETT